ncbi:MAG TPA: GAF domain-containing protein [Candidatus Limnocylindria bacterium]|nr:GAF domain-containing protein [Candidatus Limnocylindria bacterium]
MTDELTELRQRHERLKLLYDVSNTLHSSLDAQEALRLIVSEAVRLTRANSGSVALFNPTSNSLTIEASHGLPPEALALSMPVSVGITGWVARHGKSARVANVRVDRRYIALRPEVRSELAVPLEVNGEVRGVINVDSDREGAFSEEDESLLQELARQAAKVIHHTWLYEQIRFKARMFESLVSISQTINSTFNLDDALRAITSEVCVLMKCKMSSLLLLDTSGAWLDLRASHGAGSNYISKPRLSAAESLVGVVMRRKKPLQVENVQTSSRYQNVEVARGEGLTSLLSAPLMFKDEAIGVLNVYTGESYTFSNEEIQILTALAELSALAIEKARLYERVVDVEEQLRQSEKLSALGLLAAEVAHEIRNPLTVMKMLFHSLDLQFPPGDPRSKDAEIMREKMDHLNKIVEQILDFARTTEPDLRAVNLNQLISDLALLVRHKLTNQNIRFEQQLAKDLPDISADAAQLEQAFLNLTLNAVEAMADGGQLTIATKALRLPRGSRAPTHVHIEFIDTGAGMTPEVRDRVLDSLLSTTKQKGTGLGLAIVRRVVEAHRGKFKIRSAPGRGTTMAITLPL